MRSIAPSILAKPSRLLRKPAAQRTMRGVEADRQVEHLADRTALHRIERRDRNPFDLVEQAERLQDRMFRLPGSCGSAVWCSAGSIVSVPFLKAEAAPPTL